MRYCREDGMVIFQGTDREMAVALDDARAATILLDVVTRERDELRVALQEIGRTLVKQRNDLQAEVKRLQAVMDAAGAFLAEPPKEMPDHEMFGQPTTAGECRALNKAYHEAAERRESDGSTRRTIETRD